MVEKPIFWSLFLNVILLTVVIAKFNPRAADSASEPGGVPAGSENLISFLREKPISEFLQPKPDSIELVPLESREASSEAQYTHNLAPQIHVALLSDGVKRRFNQAE